MSVPEPEYRGRLLDALKSLSLDENWATAVAALCAQEIAVRKRLEDTGEESSDEDFQVLADRLIATMKKQGQTPPEILLSLVRAHTKLRAKLVHHGHQTEVGTAEVNSLVTNTADLVNSLFQEEPPKTMDTVLAEELLGLERSMALAKLTKLKPSQRKAVALGLMAKYNSFWSQPSIPPGWDSWDTNCRALMDATVMNLPESEVASFLDTAIRAFSIGVPQRLMQLLSFTCGQEETRRMLQEKGHIGWVVTAFCLSSSYENASLNASIIFSLAPLLSKSQIETVLNSLLSNSQIRDSWGAQSKMKSFIDWAEDKVDPGLITHVRDNFPPRQ